VLEPANSDAVNAGCKAETSSAGAERGAADDDEVDEAEVEQAPREMNRTGRLLLYKIDASGGLTELQRIETNAILDAKWCVLYVPLSMSFRAIRSHAGRLGCAMVSPDYPSATPKGESFYMS
jgi:hypothetical protein